jgi:flagellar biogenesis protein FliO
LEGRMTMLTQTFRYMCLFIGVVSLAVWFIRVVFAGRRNGRGPCESLIQVRDRKRVTDKAELIAISFQNQMHLLGVSGERIRLLVTCCDRLNDAPDNEQNTVIMENR